MRRAGREIRGWLLQKRRFHPTLLVGARGANGHADGQDLWQPEGRLVQIRAEVNIRRSPRPVKTSPGAWGAATYEPRPRLDSSWRRCAAMGAPSPSFPPKTCRRVFESGARTRRRSGPAATLAKTPDPRCGVPSNAWIGGGDDETVSNRRVAARLAFGGDARGWAHPLRRSRESGSPAEFVELAQHCPKDTGSPLSRG